MKLAIIVLFLLQSCGTFKSQQPNICKVLKLDNCNNSKRGLSRSAGASLPSVNAAAFSNPAAIALNKGWGVESITFGNESQLGLVYGTGRVGGAVASSPNDGTFFGNLAVEDSQNYRRRVMALERFKEEKWAFSGGVNLFGGDEKRGLSLDIGGMWRRHLELEEDHFGGGLTLTWNKILSLGVSQYNDVYYQDLRDREGQIFDQEGNATSVIFGSNSLYEYRYRVTSFVYGLKFSVLAFDYITLKTEYEDEAIEPSYSTVWNMSYFYRRWIFSYGKRFEESFKEVYDSEEEIFLTQKRKDDVFLGAQYALPFGLVVGGFYNYYLLDDLSLGLTYFF
ncbi:MAG: hypothetical protein CME65_02720 [Halobacteriovoraceae bacterium]|nr:hypothetical protein [Halobacteriovoraceae bacterium]|tara:strand:- start:5401 stop:6408 length:1008 start_codon:yes stop_codon:yes gene_type:complete